jgi:rhomboid protease GluP
MSPSVGDRLVGAPEVGALREQVGRQNRAFYDLMGGRRPIATYVLIAINVVIFVALTVYAGSPTGAGYGHALDTFGDSSAYLVEHGQWWRLFTAMFLHGSFEHVLLNMISLLYLGVIAERLYGSVKFIAIYVGSGLAGSVASVLFNALYGDPHVASVGASGAIFGIAGALLTLRFQHSDVIPRSVRDRISSSILPIVLINLVFSRFLAAYIDNSAHVGGLLGGIVLSFVFPLSRELPDHSREQFPSDPPRAHGEPSIDDRREAEASTATDSHDRTV